MSDQDDQLEFDDTEEWQGGPIGSMGPSLPSGNKTFDPDLSKVFGVNLPVDYMKTYIQGSGGGGQPPLHYPYLETQGRNPNYKIPSQNETKESCEHQPIDVGFNVSKIVCKLCNKDL